MVESYLLGRKSCSLEETLSKRENDAKLESPKEEVRRHHHRHHREMEEMRKAEKEEAGSSRSFKKKTDSPRDHREHQEHRKHREHRRRIERALSPDNTLREVVGGMPHMQLTHSQSNEPIYTDEQLM